MTDTERICRIIRQRSQEHKEAITLLSRQGLHGQAVSILRQELDSMVRTIFLLQTSNLAEREHLISQTLNGEKWRKLGSKAIITDKDMVDMADNLNGWTKSVYTFGCAFIHLSSFHDYLNTNPFDSLSSIEIQNIKMHLNNYHGFPLSSDLSMDTIRPYIPMVFDKISSNLQYCIGDLEAGTIGAN